MIDTWTRLGAWNGIDPGDNAGVARLCAALDEIKAAAGVTGLAVSSHMPHAARTDRIAERAIGAQAFSGWVDEMWRYVRHESGARFLSADGRDVQLAECEVINPPEGTLRAFAGDRSQRDVAAASQAVVDLLGREPRLGTNAIERALDGHDRNNVRKALRQLVTSQAVVVEDGPNNSRLHSLAA